MSPDEATVPPCVVHAKRIHTLNPDQPSAAALLIEAGRVRAAGTARQMRRMAPRGSRVLDCRDAVLTPGLVDSHTHFFYWALQRHLVLDLGACRTRAALTERLAGPEAQRRLGGWLVGRSLNWSAWGDTLPSAADLDALLPRGGAESATPPALLMAADGHAAWVNHAALELARIGPQTPDPPGGRIERDGDGRPTGIIRETALHLLPNPLRALADDASPAALRLVDQALADATRAAHRFGLVGVHTMDDAGSLRHLLRQRQVGALRLRVVHAIPLADFPAAARLGLRCGLGDAWLRIGGVKIFADGTLGSKTAYMFDEYPGRPGDRGVPVVAGAELAEHVAALAQAGFPAWVHAIGDRAAHDVIAAVAALSKRRSRAGELAGARAAAMKRAPNSRMTGAARGGSTSSARGVGDASLAMPHRIEHAQCVRPDDIRRMARLGIVASVQPCHLPGDIDNAERDWPAARRHAYPLRRMLSAGVTLACGSDVPIVSLDPRLSFFGALARARWDGTPGAGWQPRERITADDVLSGFTRGAAAAAGEPWPAGTLAPGAAADITIWGADPLRAATDEWLDFPLRGCIVGGIPMVS